MKKRGKKKKPTGMGWFYFAIAVGVGFIAMSFTNLIFTYKGIRHKSSAENNTVCRMVDKTEMMTEIPDIEVETHILTAASMDHSAWITDGKVHVAGGGTDRLNGVNEWEDIVQVAVSDDHIVGLEKNGTLHAAGSSDSQQCMLDGQKGFIYVDAGLNCTAAVNWMGDVVVSGLAEEQVLLGLANEKDAAAVRLNDKSAGVLHKDGTVRVYGNLAAELAGTVSEWESVKQIDLGVDYIVGLTKKGSVLFAGSDRYSQQECEKWKDIEYITAGSAFVAGIKKDGTACAVGRNYKNECNVSGWKDLSSIAGGYDHTVAVSNDDEVMAAGYNVSG